MIDIYLSGMHLRRFLFLLLKKAINSDIRVNFHANRAQVVVGPNEKLDLPDVSCTPTEQTNSSTI